MKSRPPSCRAKALSGLRAGACGGLAVVLATFSLLLQALLPLMPATAMASGAGISTQAMASLCLTEDVPVPDRHGVPARHEPGQASPACPICLGLHLVAAYVPPPALAIPLPRLTHDVRATTRSGAAPAEAWSAASQPRGPPNAA